MKQLKNAYVSVNEHVAEWSNRHYWITYCLGTLILVGAALAWPIMTVGMAMWGASNLNIVITAFFVLCLAFFGFKFCMSAVFFIAFA